MDKKEKEKEFVFFLGKRTSPSRIFDDKGLIGVFQNAGGSVITQPDGTLVRADDQVWLMQLNDPELIERAKAHPAFGRKFNQITHIPEKHGKGNIRTGVMGNVDAIKAEAKAEAEKEYQSKLDKFKRYYQLAGSIIKKDGKPVSNADPALIQEYETLKTELGV